MLDFYNDVCMLNRDDFLLTRIAIMKSYFVSMKNTDTSHLFVDDVAETLQCIA